MTPVRFVRGFIARAEVQADARGDKEAGLDAADAFAHFLRIDHALRHLTHEHGSQCRCQGCEVLREGT